MSKHYGNLEIYGFVTVGKNTSGEYTFPVFIGENGEFLGVEDSKLVFKRPGSTIDIAEISGGQNVLDNIEQLTSIVSEISGSEAVIIEDVFSDLTVGAIEAGDIVTEGTTFQEFVQQLLTTTFFPSFTNPTFSLGRSGSSQYEIGHILNITLTGNFNRGSINGALDGGIWNPSLSQGLRAGPANLYTINGVPNGTNNQLIISNYQILPGSQNWSASVSFDAGQQPIDSKGNNYLSPLAPGTLSANSSNINGRRRSFWGTVETINLFTESAEVRALPHSQLNLSNGSSFTINIPIGAEQVVFAYPTTLDSVDKVIYIEGLSADVKDAFTELTISVESSNGFDSVDYRVYYYIPVEPFSATSTYVVTI